MSNPNSAQISGSGRNHPPLTTSIVLLSVNTALVLVITSLATTPIPGAAGQRFDAGDIMVFIAALTFGPAVGGFAGGVGSALSDALAPGGQYFAPFTLIVKGTEGFLAGYLSRRNFQMREEVAWIVSSVSMVAGYFVVESYGIALVFSSSFASGLGLAPVLEVPFNILQVVAGGIIGIPVSRYLKKMLPATLFPAGR